MNAEDNTFCERTPLDWATINGDLAIIRTLLDHTAKGIKLSPHCLRIAIANHHDIEIVRMILNKADELGIDVDTNRHPPFYVACAMEEWKCEICAKVFGCRKKLRMHLMVHCEEKPYACKHCAYR